MKNVNLRLWRALPVKADKVQNSNHSESIFIFLITDGSQIRPSHQRVETVLALRNERSGSRRRLRTSSLGSSGPNMHSQLFNINNLRPLFDTYQNLNFFLIFSLLPPLPPPPGTHHQPLHTAISQSMVTLMLLLLCLYTAVSPLKASKRRVGGCLVIRKG